MSKKFWMVWRENGRVPMKKHYTEDSAKQEALRIATIEWQEVFVLEVVGACAVSNICYKAIEGEV